MGRTGSRRKGLLRDVPNGRLKHPVTLALETYWGFQKLHTNQEHPDIPLLGHVRELISKLEELGIHPSSEEDGDDDGGWEDVEGSDDEDEDVEMT